MASHLSAQPFDPWAAIQAHQQTSGLTQQFGATASFIGTMRDLNEGVTVSQMSLEHYPAMTEHYLNKLEQQAQQGWPLLDSLIIHRIGDIKPGDPIVLIACWSAHRRAALDACSWLIEELKHRAPFWKKEHSTHGAHWVQGNSDGH